jgi:hypothetical protein
VADAQLKLGVRNAIAVSEAYMQADDQAAAAVVLKSAIALKPEEVDLKFQLGAVHERSGDRKAAE